MLGEILAQSNAIPKSISSDHDPLFEFHRWKANLRVLEIREIKTVPNVPLSHPFIERLIGTVRQEFLAHVPFWTSRDLERKLESFKKYYNRARAHRSLLAILQFLFRVYAAEPTQSNGKVLPGKDIRQIFGGTSSSA